MELSSASEALNAIQRAGSRPDPNQGSHDLLIFCGCSISAGEGFSSIEGFLLVAHQISAIFSIATHESKCPSEILYGKSRQKPHNPFKFDSDVMQMFIYIFSYITIIRAQAL